jgi:hypothetical protein
MGDLLELLLNFLSVGDVFTRTGEEILALFDVHSNFFIAFVVGLAAWSLGFGSLLAVALH